MPPIVLIFGHDRDLLATRAMVLRKHGLQVIVAAVEDEVEAALSQAVQGNRIDLLMLCHSLRPDESEACLARISSCWPGLQKLQLSYPAQAEYNLWIEEFGPDQVFDVHSGPGAMLRQIDRLLGRSAGA